MLRSLLILFVLAGGGLVAAPAPLPKPPRPGPPPPAFVGSWRMQWKSGVYYVRFGPDGSYQCDSGHAGTWCLDAENRILYVEELSQSGAALHWSVTLCGPRDGTLDDMSEWRLEPVRPLAP